MWSCLSQEQNTKKETTKIQNIFFSSDFIRLQSVRNFGFRLLTSRVKFKLHLLKALSKFNIIPWTEKLFPSLSKLLLLDLASPTLSILPHLFYHLGLLFLLSLFLNYILTVMPKANTMYFLLITQDYPNCLCPKQEYYKIFSNICYLYKI